MSQTRTAAEYRERFGTIRDGIQELKAQVTEKGYCTPRDIAIGRELLQQFSETLDDLELDIPLDEQIKEAEQIQKVLNELD